MKLLRKALLYRALGNLNELISKSKLTHRELSSRTGNSENWFNDVYNNNEDITISSLARILSTIGQELNIEHLYIESIFNHKILVIASLIGRLSDEDQSYLDEFILDEKSIFVDLLGDWASMSYRNKLKDMELTLMNQIREIILNS